MKKYLYLLLFVLLLQPICVYGQDEQAETTPISIQQEKVRRILDKFVTEIGKDPRDYTITVEDSDQLNAYATLGKRIVVYTGLINSISSEAGLAFVIGHELGHIVERHVINSFLRQHFFSAVKYFFFRESAIYDGVNYLHSLHYSRGGEREADFFAEELVNKFYCNVPGKLEFFEEAAKNRSGGKLSEYLSTHPHPASRLEYMKEEITAAGCVI